MAKGKSAKTNGILTRINFSKTNFPDQSSVKAFLDKNGIEGHEIVDESDIFAAKSTELEGLNLEKALPLTSKVAGVTMYVAAEKADDATDDTDDEDEGDDETAEPEAGAQPEDVTAKGASKAKVVDGKSTAKGAKAPAAKSGNATDTVLAFPAQKYDWWAGYMSDEGNLFGVLKDGIDYDGLPPGMDEVMQAVFTSAGNVFSSSDDNATKETMIKQIGEDMSGLMFGLYQMFEKATDDATKSANSERRAKAAKFVETFSASVTRAAKAEWPVDVNVSIADEDEEETPPAKKTKALVVPDTGLDEEAISRIVGAAVAKAVAPVNEQVTALRAENEALQTQMSRSSRLRSDQSIIDNLASEDDEEEETAVAKRNDAMDAMRSVFGVKSNSYA